MGDAFGLATEFRTVEQVRRYYGHGQIKFGTEPGYPFVRDAFRVGWQEGDFTDDTDQLLLLVGSLLETDGRLDPTHFAYRLHEWVENGFPELDKPSCGIGFTIGSTITHALFRSDPHHAAHAVWEQGGRESASNGAVMRTSAVGIPFWGDEAAVVENAIGAAKVTHADPRSVTAAVVVSVLVSRILRQCDGQEAQSQPINKQRVKELLHQGTSPSEAAPEGPTVVPKSMQGLSSCSKAASAKLIRNFKRFKANDGKMEEWGPFQLENSVHDPSQVVPDPRDESPVKITTVAPPSLDTYGQDPFMTRLCSQVVNDYKLMLEGNQEWIQELEFYTSATCLAQLRAGDGIHERDIGYCFKCLGYGLYCASRAIPTGMTAPDFFKAVLTELTLGRGDADTNGAVAGALIGVRLGAKGLPMEWVTGLRHAAYLNPVVDALVARFVQQ